MSRRANWERWRWVLGVLAAGSAGLVPLLLRELRADSLTPHASSAALSVLARESLAEEVALAGAGRTPVAAGPGAPADSEEASPASVPGADLRFAGPAPDAGEKEQHAFFLALAARDPETLEKLAPSVLRGEDPDCRKVALLRALYETSSPATPGAFALAIRELPDRSGPQALSVPEFAVGFLGERAERDACARGLLRQVAFETPPPRAPALRRRAAALYASTATDRELRQLVSVLALEDELAFRTSVAAGLASNPRQRSVELLFADLPVPRAPLAEEDDRAHERQP